MPTLFRRSTGRMALNFICAYGLIVRVNCDVEELGEMIVWRCRAKLVTVYSFTRYRLVSYQISLLNAVACYGDQNRKSPGCRAGVPFHAVLNRRNLKSVSMSL